MTKQELIKRVARNAKLPDDMTKKMVAALIDATFSELRDYFTRTKASRRTRRFTYPKFGTFTKKVRRARPGRHPRTGLPIAIPSSVTLSFQPSQDLRRLLNRPSKNVE